MSLGRESSLCAGIRMEGVLRIQITCRTWLSLFRTLHSTILTRFSSPKVAGRPNTTDLARILPGIPECQTEQRFLHEAWIARPATLMEPGSGKAYLVIMHHACRALSLVIKPRNARESFSWMPSIRERQKTWGAGAWHLQLLRAANRIMPQLGVWGLADSCIAAAFEKPRASTGVSKEPTGS